MQFKDSTKSVHKPGCDARGSCNQWEWPSLKTGITNLNKIEVGYTSFVRFKWKRKTHADQKSPKAVKRDRTITLFFLILRLSSNSVRGKSVGNPRHVASTHNNRPHLALDCYGTDRHSSNSSSSSSALRTWSKRICISCITICHYWWWTAWNDPG